MKNADVDANYVSNFLKKCNVTPNDLILEYNINNTRACVVIKDASIKVANYMKVENAQKFIDDVRKTFYNKSKIKRIK